MVAFIIGMCTYCQSMHSFFSLKKNSFKDDQRNGMGEYQWPDGACYKGFFRAGHRDGEGEYRFAGTHKT